MDLNGIEIVESELKDLINNKEFVFYREIKSIPNQVLGCKLRPTEKCSGLEENNPYNEPIYYQIRYDLDVKGTWTFRQRYGISLKKNIYPKYGKNEKLYIKEPFLKSDNGQTYYDYLNATKEHKCSHQRYMKQEDARYFVEIVNVEIERIDNFYLDNEPSTFNVLNEEEPFSSFSFRETTENKKTVEQKIYSHKYQLKYTCKLIENPFENFVPSDKIKYFYRIQIPEPSGVDVNYITWRDFKVGYIEASSQKEARKLLEDEMNCELPSKVVNNEFVGTKYSYILKTFPPDTYWDKYWGGTRICSVCGNEYTMIDKINHFEEKSDNSCCSPDCYATHSEKYSFLKEEEYLQKLMSDEEGIHQPCIYLISNLKTGMVYVGQTINSSTFRWYQHFKRPYSGSKFHNAILDHDLSDWTFQVIEVINEKTLEENNITHSGKSLYITQREQHWINHYDSIDKGYNTATANKELHEMKKNIVNGLFTQEELNND